jgi:hypothetical protein
MIASRFVVVVVIAVCVGLSVTTSSTAQTASIGVGCDLTVPTGLSFFSVTLTHTLAPIKTASFKVVTSCPVTIINSDFTVIYGNCMDAGSLIGALAVQNNGPTITNCNFDVVPLPGYDDIELTDCDGYPMTGRDTYGWAFPCDNVGNFLGAYRPNPPDGAVDVPINALLSWVGYGNVVFMADNPFENPDGADRIVCATQPFPYYDAPPCDFPVDPGLLQPYTTYYWQAILVCWGCYHGEGAVSDVFSFTTGGPIAVEQSTWGRVKAMYRD